MDCASIVELIGRSGARYPYLEIDYRQKFYAGVPGVIVLLSATARTRPILYYAGEQENLFRIPDLILRRALNTCGTFRIFARVNADASQRQSELDDIIGAYDPPLNRTQV